MDVKAPPPPSKVPALPRGEQIRQLKSSVFVSIVGKSLRRCFLCVAKATNLAPEGDAVIPKDDSVLNQLVREFYSGNTLARHFIKVHLGHTFDVY